ncbi:MAG: hypothetical protein VR67_19215 [Peptococcaceae bacterium BRH_c8a]|nr:MAG: hypothetical protein VR67_19215 [Peptococcaceae bacterium BRH_c8a]
MLVAEGVCSLHITEITKLVRGVKGNPRTVFDRLFDITEYTGALVLPEGIRDWAASKFGDLSGVEKQQIIKITNRVTLEGTLFNALRALRPLPGGDSARLDRSIEEHQSGCAFCKPDEKTPADTFGRLVGINAITASNVAKYDRWHSLIIPDEHHPLRFDAEQVADYFSLAGKWFGVVLEQPAAGQAQKQPRYPFLMWNCLWPAGSSVVHGHLQVTVTTGMHYPKVERLRRDAAVYRQQHGENYFEDLYLGHRVAGLALKEGDARIFASLTPIKEKETWVVLPGKSGLEHLAELGLWVGRVLTSLRENGTSSFNVAVYIPPPDSAPEDWAGFPLIARVVDRGDAAGRTADFGGMELYAASVVSTDPFQVAHHLRIQVGDGS